MDARLPLIDATARNARARGGMGAWKRMDLGCRSRKRPTELKMQSPYGSPIRSLRPTGRAYTRGCRFTRRFRESVGDSPARRSRRSMRRKKASRSEPRMTARSCASDSASG